MQNRIRQFLQTLLLNRKGATLNRQVRKDVTVDRKMHYERKCHSAVEAK